MPKRWNAWTKSPNWRPSTLEDVHAASWISWVRHPAMVQMTGCWGGHKDHGWHGLRASCHALRWCSQISHLESLGDPARFSDWGGYGKCGAAGGRWSSYKGHGRPGIRLVEGFWIRSPKDLADLTHDIWNHMDLQWLTGILHRRWVLLSSWQDFMENFCGSLVRKIWADQRSGFVRGSSWLSPNHNLDRR